MAATKVVPVLVGHQQWAAIRCPCGDQHHVVPGHVEMTLQVVVDIPGDLGDGGRSEQIGQMTHRQVVGFFVVQSSCRSM